ncbi:acyltransferase [Cloacibacterium sp.]|uniref:acyltransferase n=1 Tax=Cloacibacterium sp. TaxID=1913682 RepID=UPI0039E6DA68
MSIFARIIFNVRIKKFKFFNSIFRTYYFKIIGMQIGNNTFLPKIIVTWPHQVSIGSNCVLEDLIFFKFDGIYGKGSSIKIDNNVFIGRGCEFNSNCNITIREFSNIASGCKFIDHDHGIKINERIGVQESNKAAILIEEDVWLGVNVVVLKGVNIGKGAVVGAGSVVTKNIPSNEIWAGVPAKKIGIRK